jgi:glucose/mannose-6-phosphate isomerase
VTTASLDDERHLARVDPSGALAAVEAAPAQWEAAREVPRVRVDLDGADAVVVCGMGGSAIGGDAAAALAADRLALPVLVRRTLDVPAFVGERTVVVAVSHSGRTEETLAAFEDARARGARLLGISTGGPLQERCDALGVPHVRVGGADLQPRLAFGWLTVPLLAALGLDDGFEEAVAAMRAVVTACGRDVPAEHNEAKRVAARLAGAGLGVLYGTGGLTTVVARRFAAQLNEMAKHAAHTAELPELGHNEIVAWQEPTAFDGAAVVWLRDPAGEHPRVTARAGVVQGLIEGRAASVDTLTAHAGAPPLARLAGLLLLADLTGVYTAIARGQDPGPIPFIDHLKKELAR